MYPPSPTYYIGKLFFIYIESIPVPLIRYFIVFEDDKTSLSSQLFSLFKVICVVHRVFLSSYRYTQIVTHFGSFLEHFYSMFTTQAVVPYHSAFTYITFFLGLVCGIIVISTYRACDRHYYCISYHYSVDESTM